MAFSGKYEHERVPEVASYSKKKVKKSTVNEGNYNLEASEMEVTFCIGLLHCS